MRCMCGATDNKVIAGKGRAAVVVKVDTDVNVFTTFGGMDHLLDLFRLAVALKIPL